MTHDTAIRPAAARAMVALARLDHAERRAIAARAESTIDTPWGPVLPLHGPEARGHHQAAIAQDRAANAASAAWAAALGAALPGGGPRGGDRPTKAATRSRSGRVWR